MGVFSASRRHLAVTRGVEDDGEQSIFNLHPQCSNSIEFMESLQLHLLYLEKIVSFVGCHAMIEGHRGGGREIRGKTS